MIASASQPLVASARVLVVSTMLAPCKSVGGKRFSYLSRYLSGWCGDYHVLARSEKDPPDDSTAFRGQVHRVRMLPYYPAGRSRGFRRGLAQIWARWFCLVDPSIGWSLPAIYKGIQLCRWYRLNVVIVTVPFLSSLFAATVISRVVGAKLVIDYRDPLATPTRQWPKPFGKWLARILEVAAIKQSAAIVLCTQPMRDNFLADFTDIAPPHVEVINNAFLEFENEVVATPNKDRTDMVYAGQFYGTRRLSTIGATLSEMLEAGDISAANFRLHIYSELTADDYELMKRLSIDRIIQVHEPVPYDVIKVILRDADILFLPSGDDVAYAVPFKFFDYLSVRRPILAVAPSGSAVHELMRTVDCGEFAEFGDSFSIRRALQTLVQRRHEYTFSGADQFRWENSARQYVAVIASVLAAPDASPRGGGS